MQIVLVMQNPPNLRNLRLDSGIDVIEVTVNVRVV